MRSLERYEEEMNHGFHQPSEACIVRHADLLGDLGQRQCLVRLIQCLQFPPRRLLDDQVHESPIIITLEDLLLLFHHSDVRSRRVRLSQCPIRGVAHELVQHGVYILGQVHELAVSEQVH